MPFDEEAVKQKLSKELQAVHVVTLAETSGCSDKYTCIVVSDIFKGKGPLERHRLVNGVLKEEIKDLHAFSQKTFTTEQWEKQKKNYE